jgi:two-component system cell cycle response regulator DivK
VILVVDDVDDNRLMYVEYLEYAGYQVAQARTGTQALGLAREVAPALIVMDLSMPDMDGWEATRRLKADPRTRRILILVVSGHALGKAEQQSWDAGADGFLTKPCLPEDLAAKIATMLARRGTP